MLCGKKASFRAVQLLRRAEDSEKDSEGKWMQWDIDQSIRFITLTSRGISIISLCRSNENICFGGFSDDRQLGRIIDLTLIENFSYSFYP